MEPTKKNRGSLHQGERKFRLGATVMTRGISNRLTDQEIFAALARHERGDWGEVPPEDWQANDEALKCGERILSSYDSEKGERFWIITEWDRSCTTVLLPEEY